MDEIREIIGQEGFWLQDIGSADLKACMKQKFGVNAARPVFTIMPGSRRHEISRLLPVLSQSILELQKKYPTYQYVIPVAPNIDKRLFEGASLPRECRLIQGMSIETLAASDAAVIASGTSTLQAAFLGVPMAVVYKLSPMTFLIGRLIVKVNHISLVNLLLEKSVSGETGLRIKELLQQEASTGNILSEMSKIIDDQPYREELLSQLLKVRALYRERSASVRVAEMIGELVRG
jgi:lipid-A-disaccharide synthase